MYLEGVDSEPPSVWTVSDLNRVVRDLLEQSLQPIWLQGEIGNLTVHRSGHVYFTLKDARSQVPAVFFRGAQQAQELDLKVGLEVEVYGRVSVYEPRGAYQVIVTQVRTKGLGQLQKEFEELKRRLRAEGLFDEDRKRPIPVLPRCVGVVTSPEGAAIRDFMQILTRRFTTMHVRIVPTAVQGHTAAAEIAAGIGYLNDTQACDVIVVTRGGGSLEDLWSFNEEPLARAIAASKIPVISAVGHERDFTICDFAADLRVPTPSAAAELVIARKEELLEAVANARRRLSSALELRLSQLRRRFERAAQSRVFREPEHAVRIYQQRLDELALRLPRALAYRMEKAKERIQRVDQQLRALNPKAVLGRGYAILLKEADGLAVRSTEDVTSGDNLRGLIAEGEIALTVQDRTTDRRVP